MSSDTMYFNRSRMLPAHNKNKSHITQTPPFSMKKSKSNRKSLELVERKSEKTSRASTPAPVDLKFNDIPQLQSLPNGERPDFGNSSNNNNNSKSTPNDNLSSLQHKSHSRKKSSSGKTHKSKDKDAEKKSKSNKKEKHSSNKKEKSLNHESAEVLTNNLKQLLLEKNILSKTSDTKKQTPVTQNDPSVINRVQNNPSPLTTFLTSPIITPDNIPPQLKINNNPTTLGQTPLMVSMQHNPQFNHQNDHNVAAAGHNNNNNNNNNNNIPIPLTNGMVNSPIMHPLTPFQMSNTIPSYPFGNNNMNYSISNVPLPLPIPSYVSPQPIPPQQTLLSGNNNLPNHNIMMNRAVDMSGGGAAAAVVVPKSNMANNNKTVTSQASTVSKSLNKSIKNNKNVNNKKMPHSFAGASFATDIPQECNLPKPSFL